MTLITKNDLKHRGWTGSLITKFYPVPNATKQNPYYKRAAPVCLYDITKVQLIEAHSEFIELKQKALKRSQAASVCSAKRLETQRQNLLNRAEHFTISLPDIPKEILVKRAIKHYNERLSFDERNWHKDEASIYSEPDFLKRITLNYVRHQLTAYDYELSTLSGKIGMEEVRERLHERIEEAVNENYDF